MLGAENSLYQAHPLVWEGEDWIYPGVTQVLCGPQLARL